MEFTKMHGIGNDFIIVNCMNKMPDFEPARIAQMVCDRHFGVGADGLMLVLPSNEADFAMRLWNSDGSVAEMCGNGIRCFSKYVYDRGLTCRDNFKVDTLDGIKEVKIEAINGKATFVTINMGRPALLSNGLSEEFDPENHIPPGAGKKAIEKIEVGGKTYHMIHMNMGVPHTVVFADKLEEVPFYTLGPAIEAHPRFPKKTNVDFVQVLSKEAIKIRVWERGAGETLACGTGACAGTVAAYLLGFTGKSVAVTLPGGTLKINLNNNGTIEMSGPATEVYSGRIDV